MNKVTVYAVGLVYASACADGSMTPEEVEQAVNADSPTGIPSKWEIATENFKTGEANPHVCEQDPARKHYLLSC